MATATIFRARFKFRGPGHSSVGGVTDACSGATRWGTHTIAIARGIVIAHKATGDHVVVIVIIAAILFVRSGSDGSAAVGGAANASGGSRGR